jgi:hypothetical protein
MAQGWHGNSEGHREAGRLGGIKSAAVRRRKAQHFREQVVTPQSRQNESKVRPDHSMDESLEGKRNSRINSG